MGSKINFGWLHLFFELKNYEQARVELKRLILERPGSDNLPKAYHQIGQSYYIEGNLNLAMISFREADKKFGYKKISLASALSLADIYEETGQLVAAVSVYQTILDRLDKKRSVLSVG